MVWIHGFDDIQSEIHKCYRGHHQYDWVRPTKTWLEAKAPVYLDFGSDELIQLCVYDCTGLRCIKRVLKRDFIQQSILNTLHAST